MNPKLLFTLAAVLGGLTACNWTPSQSPTQPPTETHQPRYQLTPAADGKLYRLDTQSGSVHLVTSSALVSLTDQTVILHVGQYYQMEDAKDDTKFLKYVGAGEFQRSKFAVLMLPE